MIQCVYRNQNKVIINIISLINKNMESNANGIKTWQWVVTVIVIIVLIILGYNMFKSSPVTAPGTDDAASLDTPSATNTGNRITVVDQAPGNIVYISSVQLSAPGFVVIHKDKAGTPGDIMGYKYFDAGIYPGQITLTSSTVEGGVYYAMLHSDDGDKVFDVTKDIPLKDSAGNIIMKLFRVTLTPTELKG